MNRLVTEEIQMNNEVTIGKWEKPCSKESSEGKEATSKE